MRMKLSLAALTLMLGGCAVQPILLNDRAAESYYVPVKTLIVDNLATESKIRVGDVSLRKWLGARACWFYATITRVVCGEN